MPDASSNPPPTPKRRGWSVIAAGLLLMALALVVIYTGRSAFSSPLAMVVVAAIGFAALLLQLYVRKDFSGGAPLWLNAMAILLAVGAILADVLHLAANFMLVAALGAVACFSLSGIVILRTLRKKKIGI